MTEEMYSFRKGDALLLIDIQRDFCPGGALPVEEGDKIVPILNGWIEVAQAKYVPVYVSRDWHPVRHMSFETHGGKWPPHCIQDSEGARFHPDLNLPDGVVKITKGVRFDRDQNSVFDETGFVKQLARDGVKRLWVGGLAQDVCVLASVLDGRKAGFEVCLLEGATRPVSREKGKEAVAQMEKAGAVIISA